SPLFSAEQMAMGAGIQFLLAENNTGNAAGGLLCIGLLALIFFGFYSGWTNPSRNSISARWGTKAGKFLSGNWGGQEWGSDAETDSKGKLSPCPDCGRKVSKLASSCPGCGRPLQP